MRGVDAGAAVAAHVRGNRAEAKRRESAQLMAPADRQFGPAVHEDDQRTVIAAAGEIEGRVAVGFCDMFGDRERHVISAVDVASSGCGAATRRAGAADLVPSAWRDWSAPWRSSARPSDSQAAGPISRDILPATYCTACANAASAI